MEMTKVEKILREKFEELERPIFLEELDISIIDIKPENLGVIYYILKGDERITKKGFYFPLEEKLKIIKRILSGYGTNEKIYSSDLDYKIQNHFKKFYPAFFNLLPKIENDFYLNLYGSILSITSDIDSLNFIEKKIKKFNYFNKGYNSFDYSFNYSGDWKDRFYYEKDFLQNRINELLSIFFLKHFHDEYQHIGGGTSFNTICFIKKSRRRPVLQKFLIEFFIKKNYTEHITIEDLSYEIGLTDKVPEEIIKPVTKKELREIFENEEYFHYDKDNDSVKMLSFSEIVEKIKNHFEQSYSNFSISESEYNKKGILALKFTGNEFPLPEAIDYINVRPIIFVYNVDSQTKIDNILLLDKEISDKENNDIKYLKSLFNNDEEYKKWLEKNTSVSFYEAPEEIVKHIYPKLVADLSPIFNIQHNPGNLFQYTLKSKLEEYLKKQNK